MTKAATAFLVLLSAAVAAHGEGARYSDPELHYSIKLPEGWRRLPPQYTTRAAEALAFQTGRPFPKYEAWFQRSDKPEGAYPYLLIGRQVCLMPTLQELANVLNKDVRHAAGKSDRDLKGFISGTKVSDAVIDARRNMVFCEVEQNVGLEDAVKVKGRIFLFPGKAGVAQLNFFDAAGEADRSKADVDFVVNSFSFEPEYRYQAGLVPDPPRPGINFDRVQTFALVGGVFGAFCYGVLKRRNPNDSPGLLRLRVIFAVLVVLGVIELLLDTPGGPVSSIFVLGCIAVGVTGSVVLWVRGVKGPSSPAREAENDP